MDGDLSPEAVSEYWRTWFMEGPPPNEARLRNFLIRIPSDERCTYCAAPFNGPGAWLTKAFLGKEPSSHHTGFCNVCDVFAQKYGGGAEVEMAMLFADIRGSTQLSQGVSSQEFSQLIERFYSLATEVIMGSSGFVERLGGDEVIAYFGPGLAGKDYIKAAIVAGGRILKKTHRDHLDSPRIPVGVGIHAGKAYFGSMTGPNGLYNITALGEDVNTAARLASQAKAGQMVASIHAMRQAGFSVDGYKSEYLDLKGIEEKVQALVLNEKDWAGISA